MYYVMMAVVSIPVLSLLMTMSIMLVKEALE